MADHMDEWVGRQTIITNSGVKKSIVNNALSALRERKIILSNLVYVDTNREVGDADHLKVFATEAAAEAWFGEK